MGSILFSKIYNELSSTTPLLIFHGLFGSLDNWHSLSVQFSKYRPVHALDLRNHGKSFHSETMNFKVMAEDIKNYLDVNSITTCYALGHSLGGKAIMEFALTYPERIEKLVVADIALRAYKPHHQSIIQALGSVDFAHISRRTEVDKVLSKYIDEVGVRQFLLKNVYKKDNDEYDFRFNFKVLARNYNLLIGAIISDKIFLRPTLFLKGAQSHYIEKVDELEIKKQFPSAIIETISHAGHWLHADNPIEFYDKVTAFISN